MRRETGPGSPRRTDPARTQPERAPQPAASQNRETQNRETQNRAAQNRAAQNRAAQTRAAQTRDAQARAAMVRAARARVEEPPRALPRTTRPGVAGPQQEHRPSAHEGPTTQRGPRQPTTPRLPVTRPSREHAPDTGRGARGPLAPRGRPAADRLPAARRPSAEPPARPAGPAAPHRRQVVILVGVLALLGLFTGRLVVVQALQGPAIAQKALDLRLHTVAIPGDRGEILDADGVVLAQSVERYNIVINQEQFGEARLTAAAVSKAANDLAPLLGVPAAELGPKLDGDRGFVYLAKGLAPEVYRQVMALGIAGVSGERTTDRTYPAGSTAGNIVGFVGAEGYGQAGLEQVYDDVLAGTAGSETYERGARGQRIPTGEDDVVPAVPGKDVQLTIDRDVQYMVQSVLDEQVRATGAEWGAVEVTLVESGEVLALADSGTVDPNDPGATPAEMRQSRAAASAFEPGSTAKIITMASILDSGIATPTSQFVVPYTFAVPNGQAFHDSHEHPDLKLTLTGILAESSNTGTVMVGQNIPKQVRHDYLAKFGFGAPTGLGLPGEASGSLHDADVWDGRSEYAVLFGQAVSVTTLQATQVFATIANDGVRVQPHIVKGVRDPDGTFHPAEVAEPQQVVSAATADTLVQMLESAVAEGTGSHAAIPGYRIAGKTGTSQAFEGGGVIKNVASFIGIAPADDPQIVVNVVLYDPKTSIYGGVVAAPVFSEVAGYALQHLGVPPSGTTPVLFPTTYE